MRAEEREGLGTSDNTALTKKFGGVKSAADNSDVKGRDFIDLKMTDNSKKDSFSGKTQMELELEELQLWDAFSYHLTIVEKESLAGTRCKYLAPSKKWYYGEYLFTIDNCHADSNTLNTSYSEVPEEHKSFNILELDNGHYAAQPNNRVIFYDKSLTPAKTLQPDFKVSTQYYSVENKSKWTAGDDTNYFYDLKEQE